MRHRLVRAGLACLAAVFAVAAMARSDDFSDYRIPTHRVDRIMVDLRASGYRHSSSNDVLSEEIRQIGGDAGFSGSTRYDSDRRLASLGIDVRLSGSSRDTDRQLSMPPQFQRETSSQQSRYLSLWPSAALRFYPGQDLVGIELAASGAVYANKDQMNSDVRDVIDSGGSSEVSEFRRRRGYDYFANLEAMVGLGRVRDASPVYQARVLEDRLLALGALTRPLAPATRRTLATLYATRDQWAEVHDRPEKYFWREVERALAADGALRDSRLDAYALERGQERETSIPQLIESRGFYASGGYERPSGAFAGLRVRGTYHHAIEDFEAGSDADHLRPIQSFDLEAMNLFVGPSGELHLPMGIHWQTDLAGSTLFDVTEQHAGDMLALASANVGFVIDDRWSVGTAASYERSDGAGAAASSYPGNPGIDPRSDHWLWIYGAGLQFLIEDQIALELRAYDTQSRESSSYGMTFTRDGGITLGVTYRVLGRFDLPGIAHTTAGLR